LQYPARAAAREALAAKRVEFVSVRARSCIFVHGNGTLNGSFAFKLMLACDDAVPLSALREDSLVAWRVWAVVGAFGHRIGVVRRVSDRNFAIRASFFKLRGDLESN
jgi:hypothetical protein